MNPHEASTPNQITIRTLSAADYEAICEVWKASGIHYQVTGRESPENFARQMQNGLQTIFGAFRATDNSADSAQYERNQQAQLVGVVVMTHDGRKGWINRLAVLPDCQRQGIGSRLVQVAEDHIHALGLEISAALVEDGNDASLNMFKRAGYQVHKVHYVSKRDHPNA